MYEYTPTVPANTPRSDPIETLAILQPGTINRVEIEYPDGCAGLVRSEFYHWDVKLWPKNAEGYFSGGDIVITFDPRYILAMSPYVLLIRSWNLDDTYPHTPRYRINVVEKGKSLVEQLKSLFALGGS